MRIELEELVDYTLIGIHTSEEDYRLAYLLNKNLNTSFSKFKQHLDFKNNTATYSIYEFLDESKQQEIYLISNKFIGNHTQIPKATLFSDSISYSTTSYLIKEKKKVDFFLKIVGDTSAFEIKNIVNKLNNIHQIITSYSINPSELKSKDFLIF
ncbi:MAG: hypothetical protein COB73_01090 [Flavobacteriaceae bacterium]|nr:MAG: hypothetical protein COB73_01090 [Flavobacteriaceae bacterium]